MKWFNIKEKSAGKKRLILCWYLYNILGKKVVNIIAFFVALITFVKNKDIRIYSKKYLLVLQEFINNENYKPTNTNAFKNVLSYANSLVDKMEAFSGKYNSDNIIFDDNEEKERLFEKLHNKKGIFFICNHIGNIQMLRSLIEHKEYGKGITISIFLQANQCKIFNEFTEKLSERIDRLKVYPIEDIGIETAIELEEDIHNGGMCFMAGDRIPANNEYKTKQVKLLNKTVEFPIGVFKIAQILKSDIYFITCLKEGNKYKVYLKNPSDCNNIDDIINEFTIFTEDMIQKAPYQFYHFYDYFNDL
ncbi:hypothetical protein IJ182_02535 [bacterium]|nr:hypothetical protein [bacterium]